MFISFRQDDFCNQIRWFELLAKINIPEPVISNIDAIIIETCSVGVSEKTAFGLSTTTINPDEAPESC